MEMILFVGIQATGKSEFYKCHFYKTHMRINLDMLRTRNRENILINACIHAKQPFVVDNTNPTVVDRERYIAAAKDAGFTVSGYYFQSAIKEAITRNEERSGKECLPIQALLATHSKLELPSYDEGFDKLFYVRIGPDRDFIVEEYQDEI
ncbi:AAA family ATPase [Oscillospiraceae bacterium MB08-C2-2]|nr:AAA family ATPase [Oscillospiraceae bacterium MB08-C2-2]